VTIDHETVLDEAGAAAAQRLLRAYATRVPVEPISASIPALTVDGAYAIQQAQVASWLREGRVVRGHKIGLTSAAMQRQLGITQPDYGHLFEDMFFEPHRPVEVARFLQPRVEPEIAFVLGRDLPGPGVTVADAVAAVESVRPALEIIDSRVADWRIGLTDTIADNASSGGVVLGADPLPVDLAELPDVRCTFGVNGAVRATGLGSDVLGSPLNALVWLANRLGELGVPLQAGHVVLSGSLTQAVGVAAGDTVTADFPGFGRVVASFA
jgi:2-keto-4-pentenoate hydratase